MLDESDIDKALGTAPEPAKPKLGDNYDGIMTGTWKAIQAIVDAAKDNDKPVDFGRIAAVLYPNITRRYQTHRLLKCLRISRVRRRLVAELLLVDRPDIAEKVLRIAATCAVSDGLGSKSKDGARALRAGNLVLGSLKARAPVIAQNVPRPAVGKRPATSGPVSEAPRLLEDAFSAAPKPDSS